MLLRRLLVIAVLVGVPVGSLWVLFGEHITQTLFPETIPAPRVAGEEESPYLVYIQKMEAYWDVYVRDGASEDLWRARLGRVPFDLPSASACLSDPLEAGAEPSAQSLAWERIGSLAALDICLTRVLNRFDDGQRAIAWLARQGFGLDSVRPETLCTGEHFRLSWSPADAGEPETLWQSLPWWDRLSHRGIVVTGEVCRESGLWYEFWRTKEPAPWFGVRTYLPGRWQR